MKNTSTHILMTGAGAPGAAGILKCMQQEPSLRVTAADARSHVAGRYLAEDFAIIPPADSLDFIPALIDLCAKKSVQMILPLVTRELIPLAQHKETFEQLGIKVLVSPLASLEIANNKSRLYEFLQWRGIEIPDFRVAENAEQFTVAASQLGFPEKTICFKPSVANGSRGFRIISNNIDDRDLLFNHKPSSVYMPYSEAVRILADGPFPELLISEYLPGPEYSVDCLARNGEPVLVVPRLRKRMINGISVEGEFVQDVPVIQYCSRILRELKLHGNIGIQVKQSLTGQFLILEINPRVQGGISTCLGAGINLPVLAILQELGQSAGPEKLAVRWETKFIRYWQEIFY